MSQNQKQIKELSKLNYNDLLDKIKNLRKEYFDIKSSVVNTPKNNKWMKLKKVKKSVTRALTVLRLRKLNEAKELYKGKKYIPKDLRRKGTRAQRRALLPHQVNKKTIRMQKKESNLPKRNYALIVQS